MNEDSIKIMAILGFIYSLAAGVCVGVGLNQWFIMPLYLSGWLLTAIIFWRIDNGR